MGLRRAGTGQERGASLLLEGDAKGQCGEGCEGEKPGAFVLTGPVIHPLAHCQLPRWDRQQPCHRGLPLDFLAGKAQDREARSSPAPQPGADPADQQASPSAPLVFRGGLSLAFCCPPPQRPFKFDHSDGSIGVSLKLSKDFFY